MAGNLDKLRRLDTRMGCDGIFHKKDSFFRNIAKDYGPEVGSILGSLVAPGLGTVIGGALGGGAQMAAGATGTPGFQGGGAQAQNDALSAQLDIATQLANIQGRQADIDLPFRSDLFSALRQRQQQKLPSILPQKPSYRNPLQSLKKATSLPGQGGAGPEGGASSGYRGGFNARPGLNEALRDQRKPRTPQEQLQGLMDKMGGGGGPPMGGGPSMGGVPSMGGRPPMGAGPPMPSKPGAMPGGGGAGMPMPGGPKPGMPPPNPGLRQALMAKQAAIQGGR